MTMWGKFELTNTCGHLHVFARRYSSPPLMSEMPRSLFSSRCSPDWR